MSCLRKINYDSIAKIYADNRKASERVVSHIAERFRQKVPSDILEIGCGTANYLFALTSLRECSKKQRKSILDSSCGREMLQKNFLFRIRVLTWRILWT